MRTNKIIFGFTVAIAALLSSCNQDNEGAIYNYSGGTQGLTFSSSTLQSVEVPASQPTFTVEMFRGATAEAATGNVEVTRVMKDKKGNDSLAVISGLTASAYNFAPGESKTTITIDITPLEVGDLATINIAVPKDNASIGAYASTRVKAVKAYEWETIGKGTYTDFWATGTDDEANPYYTANVDIMKAKGFDRFRIMNPYKDYLATDMAAESWGNWIAPSSANFVEFYTVDDVIYYEDYFTGLYYQGDKTAPIYVCHPSGWSSLDPSHNKWIDEKTLQFAPYFYIDGLGGWNYTQYDEVIVVTLP